MITLPTTFESSRERFRASLASFSKGWLDARTESYSLSNDNSLSIDVIIANANHKKENLFLLTTGLHGIEGYVGSGILQLFIEEFLVRFDPETTGVILIHPINPYGMKNHLRVNKNSIDLNRNFNSNFENLKRINPHYESLAYLLNPAKPLKNPIYEKTKFIWNVIKALPNGVRHIRETALMGQYRVYSGMQFGGFEAQEETKFTMDLYQQAVKDYSQILALDIHTGYGPRWQMTLLNPPSQEMTAQETATKFHIRRVAGVNPEEFYSINGDMSEWLSQMLKSKYPEKEFYVGGFEFGTYGDSLWQGIHSLRTTVLEHALRWFGGSDGAKAWMKKEYDELFLPSEAEWWQKAQTDTREAFEGIFNAFGLLH